MVMLKLAWIFGLILLFFLFLLINHKLDKKIKLIKSVKDPNKKDKIKLFLYLGLDKLFSLVLLVYFIIVIFSIVGLITLIAIAILK